uniref:Uncharacterized protein n=1 Tax=Stomoxys calcitrans TaxID=35570 RepID=A0A1I8P7T7_STOCA
MAHMVMILMVMDPMVMVFMAMAMVEPMANMEHFKKNEIPEL